MKDIRTKPAQILVEVCADPRIIVFILRTVRDRVELKRQPVHRYAFVAVVIAGDTGWWTLPDAFNTDHFNVVAAPPQLRCCAKGFPFRAGLIFWREMMDGYDDFHVPDPLLKSARQCGARWISALAP